MKQVAMVVVMLALVTFGAAQQQPAAAPQDRPASACGPAAGRRSPRRPGKRPPQAKTQPEYEAYNAATAQTNDSAAMEKAPTISPPSFLTANLRVLLYRDAMHAYQRTTTATR